VEEEERGGGGRAERLEQNLTSPTGKTLIGAGEVGNKICAPRKDPPETTGRRRGPLATEMEPRQAV